MIEVGVRNALQLAVIFGWALLDRDYALAHSLLSNDLQAALDISALREGFEAFVPLDWEDGDIPGADVLLEDWPDRQEGDVALLYVPIAGAVYSEAVTIVVCRSANSYRIREVEFGRP